MILQTPGEQEQKPGRSGGQYGDGEDEQEDGRPAACENSELQPSAPLRAPRACRRRKAPRQSGNRGVQAMRVGAGALVLAVVVGHRNAPFRVGSRAYPANSLVVMTSQAFRPHIW